MLKFSSVFIAVVFVSGLQAQHSVTKKHTHRKNDTIRFAAPPIMDTTKEDNSQGIEIKSPNAITSNISDDPDYYKKQNADTGSEIFTRPEEEAQFPGGLDSLNLYLRKNIHYPDMAKDQGITGKVYLTFMVDTDGNIKDIKVLRSANPMLDKEAIRCIRSMPKWSPAKNNHSAVRSIYYLPISFRLQ